MKTFVFVRNRSLPFAAIAAMLLGGSCSESFVAGPEDADAVIETRATPTITVTCDPTPKGENQNYLGLKETYKFGAIAKIIEPPFAYDVPGRIKSVFNSDGGTDGVEVEIDRSDLLNGTKHVKFTKPGYYHVVGEAEHNGAVYQTSKTFCVASRAKSVVLPDTIRLGEPFDLTFNFFDPAYPAPTVEVSEQLFSNGSIEGLPATQPYTILDNDDQGHIRLRIDQPGHYLISTGLGGIYSAWADLKIYWRPEDITTLSFPFIEKPTRKILHYNNSLEVCDSNEVKYTSLPYRLYMEYTSHEMSPLDDVEPSVSGTIMRAEGTDGNIPMPSTGKKVNSSVVSWDIYLHPAFLHWDLTIPDDKKGWLRAYDGEIQDPIDPSDPDNPGGMLDPMDPPGGTIIIP